MKQERKKKNKANMRKQIHKTVDHNYIKYNWTKFINWNTEIMTLRKEITISSTKFKRDVISTKIRSNSTTLEEKWSGWRDGSVVKGTGYCSSRRLWSSSQHPHGSTQSSETPVPGDMMPSLASEITRHACVTYYVFWQNIHMHNTK